jgi:hypothetical protein
MSKRPNFYRLLRLDPAEDSWPVIERRIEEIKRESNTVRTDAAKAQQREAEAFRIYLGDKGRTAPDTIYTVMHDPAARKAEAHERRSEIHEEERTLTSMLRVLQNRGSYAKKDLADIARQVPGFDEAAIRARLVKLGVNEETAAAVKTAKPKSRLILNGAEALSIEADLAGLQLPSLYDFLGNDLQPRSSQAHIEAACRAQDEVIAKLVRGTPEQKVRSAILSHARKHLLDRDNKEKYDNYLSERELRKIDLLIRLAGGEAKVVTENALETIIKEAHVKGATPHRIREYVEEWVGRTKGFTLAIGKTIVAERLLSCGFCGSLASAISQDKCSDCGRPLKSPCPNPSCKEVIPTQDACCPACGYVTGDAPHVERLLKEGAAHLNAKRFAQARSYAEEVLNLWPGYARASELLATAKDGIAEQGKLRGQVEELIRLRKLLQAQRLAGQLAANGQAVDTATERQIVAGIDRAREACKEASRLAHQGNSEKALEKYLEALTHCVDMSEASTAISKYPPPAPHGLSVSASRSLVRLQWQCVGERKGTKFVVRRKRGGLPASMTDGEELARVSGTRFDDTTSEGGYVYYYAVYSVWGETGSLKAAVSDGVLYPAPVARLSATSIDGVARLTWRRPPPCELLEVTREPDGRRERVRGEEFIEEGLKVGATVTYSVAALYPDPTSPGQYVRSTSERIVVVVSRRPTAVMNLSATVVGNRAKLQWTPPSVGRLEIRLGSKQPEEGMVGSLIDVAEARTFGEGAARLGVDSAEVPLPKSGQLFLVPITVDGSTAIVGQWRHIANLPEVINLQCRPLVQGAVKLIWDWPDGIDSVRITLHAISAGAAGAPVLETSEEVTRGAYQQRGDVWQVRCSRAMPYRITVATKSSHGGFYSTGVSVLETFGHENRVNYRVNSGRMFWMRSGDPKVELWVDAPDVNEMSDVVVVGLPDRLPTRIDDGQVLHTAKRVVFHQGRAELPLSVPGLATSLYVKLFLKYPDRHPGLRIMPISKDKSLLKR